MNYRLFPTNPASEIPNRDQITCCLMVLSASSMAFITWKRPPLEGSRIPSAENCSASSAATGSADGLHGDRGSRPGAASFSGFPSYTPISKTTDWRHRGRESNSKSRFHEKSNHGVGGKFEEGGRGRNSREAIEKCVLASLFFGRTWAFGSS